MLRKSKLISNYYEYYYVKHVSINCVLQLCNSLSFGTVLIIIDVSLIPKAFKVRKKTFKRHDPIQNNNNKRY